MDIFGFWLSAPVFYIIGLVVFIRWLVHGGKSQERLTREQVAAQLRERAALELPEHREVLLSAAAAIEVVPAKTATSANAPAATASSTASAHHAASTTPAQAATSTAHSQSTDWLNRDLSSGLHSLDNINLILFLGAFLVVVSAGIFIGYNYEALSGSFKTAFLGAFAGLFYCIGLAVYQRSKKLRPAGSTFTGIGLILLPLVGVAAYNFTAAHDVPGLTWFITSIVTIVFYACALYLTRQTYIAYATAFTALSTFESLVKLIGVPVYWYGWVMAVTGLILLVLGHWRGWWHEARQSLYISANIFIPIALGFSVLQSPAEGWWQLSVTLVLSAAYYSVMAWLDRRGPAGLWYFAAALVILPFALIAGTVDVWPNVEIATALLVLSAGYVLVNGVVHHKFPHAWQVAAGTIAGFIPLLALLYCLDSPRVILACLLAGAAVNVAYATQLRQTGLAFLATIFALAIPVQLLVGVLTLSHKWTITALAYLALVPLGYLWRRYMRDWPDSPELPGVGSYSLALMLAALFAAIAGTTSFMYISLAIAAAWVVLGRLERQPGFIYVAGLFYYLSVGQLPGVLGWPGEQLGLVILVSGLVVYAAAFLLPSNQFSRAIRYSGLAGPYLAACLSLGNEGYTAPSALAVGAILLGVEAWRERKVVWAEAAGGIFVLALDWYLERAGSTSAQLYSLPWSAYLAILAYRRRRAGHEVYDGFVAGALAFLTFPIGLQALATDGQWYGLELIFVAIGLVLAGAAFRYKLVAWWGAATLIAETLYQMRDLLFAIPKYLISAALGVALLAVAVWLLSRRKQD